MPLSKQQYVDLFDVLPNDVSLAGYCDRAYDVWENTIAAPALRDLGYELLGWKDGERDSFGPLSRIVTVKFAGSDLTQQLVYG